jgi:DNA-directed RNA polymerase subunit M/transcription elongation factor TFIIS
MKVIRLNLDDFLTSKSYNPSPNRFREEETSVSERNLPVIYNCEKCGYSISFKTDDFKKHTNSKHSNLQMTDKKNVDKTIKQLKLRNKSFLDFYCPKCEQATVLLFDGGPSGYWGMFEFEINHIFVLKHQGEKDTIIWKLKKMLKNVEK